MTTTSDAALPGSATTGLATSGATSKAYLADLEIVELEEVTMGPHEVKSNGRSFVKAVSVFKGVPGRSTLGYDTGRQFSRFTAVLGLTDDSHTMARQRFEVYGDGRRLFTADISFGQSRRIDIPIRGVLRMQLVVTSLANDYRCTAAWADAAVE